MNEKTCPKCSKEIPGEAVICKHCGANLKKKNWFKKHPILTVLLILFGIPMLIGFISAATTDTTSTSPTNSSIPVTQPVAEEKAKIVFPIDFTSSSITTDSIGYPEFNVVIKNKSKKTIDAIEIITKFTNNFGDPVNEYGIADKPYFKGRLQEKITPGASTDGSWSIMSFSGATKIKDLEVYRIHYTDGTTLSNE